MKPSKSNKIKIISIGASSGGVEALEKILPSFPETFPVPIVCVQHLLANGSLQLLVDWLGNKCNLKVKIAQAGKAPLAGTVYFSRNGQHLELNSQGRFTYTNSSPVEGYRPSVTVTFNSVANHYGNSTLGVLLTGLGRDGADGLLTIAKVGGVTIAQDEATCEVFGMPREAIALGAAKHILPLSRIAPVIEDFASCGEGSISVADYAEVVRVTYPPPHQTLKSQTLREECEKVTERFTNELSEVVKTIMASPEEDWTWFDKLCIKTWKESEAIKQSQH